MERLRKLRRTVAMLIVFSIVVSFASIGLTNEVKALAPYIAFKVMVLILKPRLLFLHRLEFGWWQCRVGTFILVGR